MCVDGAGNPGTSDALHLCLTRCQCPVPGMVLRPVTTLTLTTTLSLVGMHASCSCSVSFLEMHSTILVRVSVTLVLVFVHFVKHKRFNEKPNAWHICMLDQCV